MKNKQLSWWLMNHKPGIRKAVLLAAVVIVCAALICTAIWLLDVTQKIDWQMQGYLVTSDGTISEALPISVTGKINDRNDGSSDLDLSFDLPEDFRNSILADEFHCPSNTMDVLSYYAFTGFSRNKEDDGDILASIALDVDQKSVVILWSDAPGQYLVASANADTNPQQILAHFQAFLNTHSTDE